MANATLEVRLLDRMVVLENEYRELLEARAANRRTLRDLVADNMLTDEQAMAVLEIYPERASRTSSEDGE
jgi:hypothetical protein